MPDTRSSSSDKVKELEDSKDGLSNEEKNAELADYLQVGDGNELNVVRIERLEIAKRGWRIIHRIG